MRQLLSQSKRKASRLLRNYRYLHRLDRLLQGNALDQKPLNDLFGCVSDDFWFWMYTEGRRIAPALDIVLPEMPDERFQLQFTGMSGDRTLEQGFSAYRLFKSIVNNYGKGIRGDSKILDFGCGWGRIIRFFLKDVSAPGLYGVDCDAEIIQQCKATHLRCNFRQVHTHPPTTFSRDTFDMIYLYSVFSHLSQEIHNRWLTEFCRILRPGGLLIATTRPRRFILQCAKFRKLHDLPFYLTGAAASFLDTGEALRHYDNGEFCFSGTGGGGVRDSSFYGEACIPKAYVERQYPRFFKFVAFFEDSVHRSFDQNVIVARK